METKCLILREKLVAMFNQFRLLLTRFVQEMSNQVPQKKEISMQAKRKRKSNNRSFSKYNSSTLVQVIDLRLYCFFHAILVQIVMVVVIFNIIFIPIWRSTLWKPCHDKLIQISLQEWTALPINYQTQHETIYSF